MALVSHHPGRPVAGVARCSPSPAAGPSPGRVRVRLDSTARVVVLAVFVAASAVALGLLLVRPLFSRRRWPRAVGMLPSSVVRVSWTDWSRVSAEADGGALDARVLARRTSRPSSTGPSTRTWPARPRWSRASRAAGELRRHAGWTPSGRSTARPTTARWRCCGFGDDVDLADVEGRLEDAGLRGAVGRVGRGRHVGRRRRPDRRPPGPPHAAAGEPRRARGRAASSSWPTTRVSWSRPWPPYAGRPTGSPRSRASRRCSTSSRSRSPRRCGWATSPARTSRCRRPTAPTSRRATRPGRRGRGRATR